jgi:hypothetical protein
MAIFFLFILVRTTKLGETNFVKRMVEEVGFGRHLAICSLHSAESITASMVQGQKKERSFVTSVSRIRSGHSSVRSHLDRI